MKKILSFLLVLTMLFTLCPAAFATSPESRELPLGGEYVTVSDDEGNLYTIWVEAKLHRAKNSRSSDGSLSDGRYSEGDQIELKAVISNDDLNFAGSAGVALSAAMKTKLGRLASSAFAPYVGATIEGGATLVGIIAPLIAGYNIKSGNNGFYVIGTFEWTHFQHQIQGIDIWDWGFVGVRVETY